MAPAETLAGPGDATEALLAEYLPEGDVTSRHSTAIRAAPEVIYSAICTMEVGRSPLIRVLFRLRGLGRDGNLSQLLNRGFIPLVERPRETLALGLVGQFWRVSGQIRHVEPLAFRRFQEPGMAKAVWIFVIEPLRDGTCRLTTSTRVACADPASRRKFRLYWFFIGPFSGLIRREVLRLIRETAEGAA
jgi:hypothetical protein